jgi:FkbM family methyltransferase
MPSTNGRLGRRLKSLAERTLGVHISRTPPEPPPNKHADHVVRRLRRWSSHDVVFDVGANDGRTVLRIQDQLCRPRIHAFEPVAATYQTLVRRTSGFSNVRTHPLALGARPGRETIYLNEIDAMNSFSADWTASPVGVQQVDVSTVDEVMAREAIDFIHFLKVDTEGHELEVLRGAEKALLESRVALIQLEVGVDQIRKKMLSLEEARIYLAARGFYLQGIYNQCVTHGTPPDRWPEDVREGYRADVLAYCDALFVGAALP